MPRIREHKVQTEIGHVRPYRTKYRHEVCGTVNTLKHEDAEGQARFPGFFIEVNCSGCGGQYPSSEFIWLNDNTTMDK